MMNQLKATIKKIASSGSLHIVKFDFFGTELSMMSLDLPKDAVVGKTVYLTVNPSYIALAKDLLGEVSYANQIEATIVFIEEGKLLTRIQLQTNHNCVESIITKESSLRMNLKVEDHITMLIKASELSIIEVLYE